MKTIHILFAAALASLPFTAYAQDAATTEAEVEAEAEAEAEAVQAVDPAAVQEAAIGSTGSGTGTIGSTGTGTGTVAAGTAEPVASLHLRSTSLRTPGSMQLTVALAAMPELSPAQSQSVVVPLASSSAECTVPASVTVAWTSADGGMATVAVTCARAPGQTVTLSSGAASASFATR